MQGYTNWEGLVKELGCQIVTRFLFRKLLHYCEIQQPKITFVNALLPLKFDPSTLSGNSSRLQIYKKVSTLCMLLREISIIRL